MTEDIIRPQRSIGGGFGGSENINDIILTKDGVVNQSVPCSPASLAVAEGGGSRNVGPHWMVAYSRNKYFTGREESIERIQELSEGNAHNRISLYGLGGAGKSQLAIEYVYRNEGLRNIFWVHGSSFLNFSQGFGSISQYIDTLDNGAGASEHGLLSNVKRWLENPASGHWILVIDNVDNENDFAGSDSAIAKFVPQGSKGTIIITTRSRLIASHQGCRVIEVGKMADPEARMLFFTRLGSWGAIGHDDDQALGRILDALDRLPLVIVGAAAYMAETNTSPSQYLELFRKRDKARQLLVPQFRDIHREVDMTDGILSTYFITFDKIKERMPLAGNLLRLIAFFGRQKIPEELLLQCGLEGVEDGDLFREATGALLGFSLVAQAKDQPLYELHRLVHRSVQVYVSMEGMSEWRDKALEVISRLFPEYTHEQRNSCAAYFPHALAVVEGAAGPVARQVGYRVGLYLRETGHYDDALAQAQKCLTQHFPDESIPNAQPPKRWYARINLLRYLGKRLKFRKPITNLVATMPSSPRSRFSISFRRWSRASQPQPDPSAFARVDEFELERLQLTSLLASILRRLGRYDEAEGAFRDVQEARNRILGANHLLTLTSLGDLALMLHDLGRYDEAEVTFRRVLECREEVLGRAHPETLKIANNIALVLHDQGRYADARSMFERTMEDTGEALGPAHPQTLTAIHNLAFALRAESNHAEAETMFRRALVGREGALGVNHPHTLASMVGLGLSLRDQGKHSEEEEVFLRALGIQEKTQGLEHVNTLECANSLALALESQGRLEEAERVLRRVADGRERVLGWGHPATVRSVNHLASILQDQGKFDEVQELFLREVWDVGNGGGDDSRPGGSGGKI